MQSFEMSLCLPFVHLKMILKKDALFHQYLRSMLLVGFLFFKFQIRIYDWDYCDNGSNA